jgi:hypothetical protein
MNQPATPQQAPPQVKSAWALPTNQGGSSSSSPPQTLANSLLKTPITPAEAQQMKGAKPAPQSAAAAAAAQKAASNAKAAEEDNVPTGKPALPSKIETHIVTRHGPYAGETEDGQFSKDLFNHGNWQKMVVNAVHHGNYAGAGDTEANGTHRHQFEYEHHEDIGSVGPKGARTASKRLRVITRSTGGNGHEVVSAFPV